MKPVFYFILFLLAFSCGQGGGSETTIEANPNSMDREVEDWNPKQNDRPLDEMIRVTSPAANAVVSSPFKVSGQAVGGWFFEGDFPITLTDEGGKELASVPGAAQGDWMQSGFVPFSGEISYDAPAGTRALLRLELDNPAGPQEGFQRAIIIPVVLE